MRGAPTVRRCACAAALAALGCKPTAEASGDGEPAVPVVASGDPVPAAASAGIAAQDGRAPFRSCERLPFATPVPGSFAHTRSSLLATGMSPLHFVQDVIAVPGARVTIEGKFSYGDIGKDLEDEPVRLHLGDCDAWTEVGGARTDDDGRARVELEAPTASGSFALRFSVDGDASGAGAKLVVAPAGTRVVVFDIDGTLTVHDREINREVLDDYFEDLYDGDYVPEGWRGGPELTRAWADKGYLLLYVTGRPYWLLDKSRAWLDDRGYAPGIVRTTLRHRDVVPSVDGVGEFKRDFFRGVLDTGWIVEAAYGNATTDVWAYGEAGIAKERTFIIGPHAGKDGTQAIAPDYESHLPWVREQADAQQPFARAR
jgi:hypothetical protein